MIGTSLQLFKHPQTPTDRITGKNSALAGSSDVSEIAQPDAQYSSKAGN